LAATDLGVSGAAGVSSFCNPVANFGVFADGGGGFFIFWIEVEITFGGDAAFDFFFLPGLPEVSGTFSSAGTIFWSSFCFFLVPEASVCSSILCFFPFMAAWGQFYKSVSAVIYKN
jgi:hypothetical protein